MKYLIAQDWPSTSGNHAGMVHMCKLLVQNYPKDYKLIINPYPSYKSLNQKNGKFINCLCKVSNKIQTILFNKYSQIRIYTQLVHQLKPGDEVFLLEYMVLAFPQHLIAKLIKQTKPDVKVYGLIHFTPSYLRKYSIHRYLADWLKPIDKVLTLGSSLTEYLLSNTSNVKVSTGFHYVDNDFYNNNNILRCRSCPTAIVMGGMQRNYKLLAEVVKQTQNINWFICKGNLNLGDLFKDYSNVKLFGYLKEEALRDLMHKSDISVNIMDDTVGSNVITTSLASGLVVVVSNVGSIRDYCTEGEAMFCENNVDSFTSQLNRLCNSLDTINSMKKNARKKAEFYSIQNIHNWFSTLKEDSR